jgi:hypothetical protein
VVDSDVHGGDLRRPEGLEVKYLLMICTTGWREPSAEEAAQMGPATDAWVEEMQRRGVRLRGHQLHPASEARTVRVRSGETTVTAGPFAEAGEQMAGFDLLECDDLDQAIEVAAAHPMASFGTVEVRPMMEDEPPG